MQENINYNLNNINGNNSTTNNSNINFNAMNINMKNNNNNQPEKKISQNKIIGQSLKSNGVNGLKSLDSSKGTISTKNINGKKFIFDKNENNTVSIDDKTNNLNRFTKIGKDPKISTKQSDKVKNIFSSKIAEN